MSWQSLHPPLGTSCSWGWEQLWGVRRKRKGNGYRLRKMIPKISKADGYCRISGPLPCIEENFSEPGTPSVYAKMSTSTGLQEVTEVP